MSKIELDPMKIEDYYFPVNHSQVRNLVGQMLTHIEALNLPEKAEQANKSIIQQAVYRWWDYAQENSLTSWKLCIGPILASVGLGNTPPTVADHRGTYVWITDIGSIQSPIVEKLNKSVAQGNSLQAGVEDSK